MKSLRDQLLKAGLTDKQSVKTVAKQKHKQPKKAKRERGQISATAQQVELARLEKAQKDKQLNQQRQQLIEEKARYAQIKQLVDGSKLDRQDAEQAYNFSFSGKVRKIYVNSEQQKQLSKGQIAIVALSDEQFELVPLLAAQKISERDPQLIVKANLATNIDLGQSSDVDPYADYQIPDDLMW